MKNRLKITTFLAGMLLLAVSIQTIGSEQNQAKTATTGDIFMIGETAFAAMTPPEGMTREAWYRQKMHEQEEYFKTTLFNLLKITPAAFAACSRQVEQELQAQERQMYATQQDLRGTWVKDDATREFKRHKGEVLTEDQNLFTITDRDIARIEQILQSFGYRGKIATFNFDSNPIEGSDSFEMLQAFNSLITIRQNFFLLDDADQAFLLRHEMSHIQHKDIIFERAIKKYVQGLLTEDGYNLKLLAQKGISLDDMDQAQDLLMNSWWKFHEYRADLEALLDMKNNALFQETIKDQQKYQGYPLSYSLPSGYEKYSNVAYLQDFLDGIANDYKKSQKEK